MSALFAIVLAAAAGAIQYDCTAEQQVGVTSSGNSWSVNQSEVDSGQREIFSWTFIVKPQADGSRTVSHQAGVMDALGLAGEYPLVPLADGQFAFSSTKARNCIFTEEACSALVEISDVDNRNSIFTLTPTGSVRREDGTREIMQIVFMGRCKRKEVAA